MFTTTTKAMKATLTALTTGTKGEEAIIRAKSTISLIPCVLLTASAAGAPTLSACDLDMNVQTELPGTASRGFRMAIDARALKKAVSKFDCERITLEDVGGYVTIRSADGTGATVKLRGNERPADYPALDYASDTKASFTLPAAQLWGDLDRVQEAVSGEETRYYLRGVFSHVWRESENGPASLRFVSTDGHRLVAITRELPEGAAAMPDIIMPAKLTAFLTRAMKKADGELSLRVSASKVAIEGNGGRIVSKLIDGTFPDYQRVIPHYNEHKVGGVAKSLVADIAMLTAHQANSHKNFTLSAGDDWATGWGRCADNGQAGAVLESLGGTSSGETVHASFNANYLTGVIGLIDGHVRLELADENAPMKVVSDTAPEFLAVIMPMRYSDHPHTPEDIARLNLSPVERFEEEAPALIGAQGFGYPEQLGKLASAAINSITVNGDRRTARTAILARMEEMAGERGRATIEAEGQPQGEFAGSFAAWSKAMKGLATRFAANKRRDDARFAAQLADSTAGVTERVTAREEVLERRIRRLTAVLAGRKAQLSTVGQALAQSRARSAALRKGAAMAGASALAAAGREAIALEGAD